MPRMPKGTPTGKFIGDLELKLGDIIEGPLGIGFVHCTKVKFEDKTVTWDLLDLSEYKISNSSLPFKVTRGRKAKTAEELVQKILESPATPTNDTEWRKSSEIIETQIKEQDERRILLNTLKVGDFVATKSGIGIAEEISNTAIRTKFWVSFDTREIKLVNTVHTTHIKFCDRQSKLVWINTLEQAGYDIGTFTKITLRSLKVGDHIKVGDDYGLILSTEKEESYLYKILLVSHIGPEIREEYLSNIMLAPICDIGKFYVELNKRGYTLGSDNTPVKMEIKDSKQKPLSEYTLDEIKHELLRRNLHGRIFHEVVF